MSFVRIVFISSLLVVGKDGEAAEVVKTIESFLDLKNNPCELSAIFNGHQEQVERVLALHR